VPLQTPSTPGEQKVLATPVGEHTTWKNSRKGREGEGKKREATLISVIFFSKVDQTRMFFYGQRKKRQTAPKNTKEEKKERTARGAFFIP